MWQSPVRFGWTGTILAVLSVVLITGITGCGQTADSGDYEVILDQPERSPEAASNAAAAATAGTKTEQAAGADNASQTLTSATTSTGKNDESQNDESSAAQPTEPVSKANATPAATPPAETSGPSTSADENTGDKNAASTEPATDETAKEPAAPTTGDSPAPKEKTPREVKLLIPEKTFKTEGPEKALRVSFDDIDLLKVLNMDPVTEDAPTRMPRWLKELDGKRIRIRGFMFPPFEETNIRGFTLARDNQICCFGRNPLVYDLVDVFMRKGETTDYIQNRPFDVIGVFHIGDSIIPGELYSLDDAIVVDQ